MKFIFLLTTALLLISAGDAKESVVPQERELRQIVGGTEAEPGSYPFQVALFKYGSQYCGGTLVDQDWVLSAAHCAGIEQVVIGAHDLSDESEDTTTIDVEWETPHPDYDKDTTDNDYMMIKLKTSAPSEYAPIALDDGTSITLTEGDELKIMGWGTTSSGGESSDVLLEADVDYVTTEKCNEPYDGAITDNMFCASRTDIDTCQGDSGGPIIVMGETNVQVGVVSWGIGCADNNYPGVYASVAKKIDWIKNEIENGVAPETENCCSLEKLYKSWMKGSLRRHFLRR